MKPHPCHTFKLFVLYLGNQYLEEISVEDPRYMDIEILCYDLLDSFESEYNGMLYARNSDIFAYYYTQFMVRLAQIRGVIDGKYITEN